MIACQHIAIHWTKAERGDAAEGARRNALPRQLEFLPPPASTDTDWLHDASFRSDGAGDYAFAACWEARAPDRTRDGISLQPRGDIAEVCAVAAHFGGKPHRANFGGLIARLPFGRRLVLRINGAWDGDHQRLYYEHAFHIGYAATATLDLPLFREIDERVLLY